MLTTDRASLRRFFTESWHRFLAGEALAPLEAQIAQIIGRHPEYHRLLENPEASLERDLPPEAGETNPFLHLGLHLSIHEQVETDRPTGIRDLYRRLAHRLGDPNATEHAIMECVGQTLWEAQRAQALHDEGRYLDCIRQLFP